MSQAAYPTSTDLSAFLFSSGLIAAPPTNLQEMLPQTAALASAITEWERQTGWVPFLSGSATTRVFDPPGPERGPVGIFFGINNMGGSRMLFLQSGLRSVVELRTGVTPTSTGTVLVVNTDFWLRPNNATTFDRPYTYIEFGYPQWGNPQSITVNGAYGFGTTIPDDAWYAILRMAAIDLVPSLEVAKFGGLLKWSESDVSETYSASPYAALVETWKSQANSVLLRYKRKMMA